MMKKDLISIKDLNEKEIERIFSLTDKLKKDKGRFNKLLSGKTLALIFQKPSNRTRVSFEVGMYQLGGNSIYLGPGEINLGVRESISDVAKTLSRYVDGIVLRTYEHKNVLEMARAASIPVINGLSDFSHPCQALADLYTVREKKGSLKNVTLAYLGDGNNVCNSLIFVCAKMGVTIKVATPVGYEPFESVVLDARALNSAKARHSVILCNDPLEAVNGADVLYTDVWASMGQEEEAAKREKAFSNFQLNAKIVKSAKKGALIMHCLPAHRGKEITDEGIDSRYSVVFDQAENRMHVQKAILMLLLGDKK
jgi:ornithine carbamoyltransferase